MAMHEVQLIAAAITSSFNLEFVTWFYVHGTYSQMEFLDDTQCANIVLTLPHKERTFGQQDLDCPNFMWVPLSYPDM